MLDRRLYTDAVEFHKDLCLEPWACEWTENGAERAENRVQRSEAGVAENDEVGAESGAEVVERERSG